MNSGKLYRFGSDGNGRGSKPRLEDLEEEREGDLYVGVEGRE